MNDPLGQLLRDVDARTRQSSVDSLGAPGDVAARVRELRRRKRRRARVVTGTAVCLLVVTSAWVATRSTKPVPPLVTLSHSQPQRTHPTLAALAMDADLHEQTAARLLRSRPARRAKSPTHAATTDVQSQRDRAALILVYEADRSARENRPADAVASYRRAIELFPQTHWAEVARQRLRLMQQS